MWLPSFLGLPNRSLFFAKFVISPDKGNKIKADFHISDFFQESPSVTCENNKQNRCFIVLKQKSPVWISVKIFVYLHSRSRRKPVRRRFSPLFLSAGVIPRLCGREISGGWVETKCFVVLRKCRLIFSGGGLVGNRSFPAASVRRKNVPKSYKR